MTKKYVWYVAYGSNLCRARFMAYIEGGLFPGNGRTYKGCSDKSPPLQDKPFLVPYEMYFGNEAASWDGMGVAFLDADKPGIALGRAYLITEEQFYDVQEQEGAFDEWYGRIVELHNEAGDIPYKTFTSRIRRPEKSPGKKYLDVIFKGLNETYPQFVLYNDIRRQQSRKTPPRMARNLAAKNKLRQTTRKIVKIS